MLCCRQAVPRSDALSRDEGSAANGYRGPLLQSHGNRDDLVPWENGRRLFEAGGGPKRWVAIPGGDHDPPSPECYDKLKAFLDRLPPARSAQGTGQR